MSNSQNTQSDGTLLPAIEIETGENPQWLVLWMHGLGADGNDFAPIVPQLGIAKNNPMRFIFPHAPSMPITCNNGYVMPAWFDILYFDEINRHADEAGVIRSRTAIRRWIAHEQARGIPASHIIVAGFSQGGAMAYTVGLTHTDPLAGVIALSTYIPAPALLQREATAANAATPIYAAHGTQDPVVPLALGEQAATLQRAGRSLVWERYPMPHSVCFEEIQSIGRWLNALASAK